MEGWMKITVKGLANCQTNRKCVKWDKCEYESNVVKQEWEH